MPNLEVLPPPDDPEDLLAWARTHRVSARLDDVIFANDGPVGTYVPARWGERLTYRQVLMPGERVDPILRRRYHEGEETARRFLHRIATLAAAQREARAFLDDNGRDPEDAALVAFLDRLREALATLVAKREGPPRPEGTYEPVTVQVAREPVPMLRYEEFSLTSPGGRWGTGLAPDHVALLLLGWNEGPLRWAWYRGPQPIAEEVGVAHRETALRAMIDLLRDPRAAEAQATLVELLRTPAWQVALGSLDQSLARIDADKAKAAAPAGERLAFRVVADGPRVTGVEPVVQKRLGGGASPSFSRGARLQWYQLPDRRDLGVADRRAYAAYDDRFARRVEPWASGSALTSAQLFGVLRALIDHPAVFLDAGN